MNFIVLSSSRGTTFQAILDRLADGFLTAKCLGLVSDRNDRGCIEKALAEKLPVKIVEKSKNESREDYDRRLDTAIQELFSISPLPRTGEGLGVRASGELRIIAAIGWLYLLSPWFVSQWKNRILNVHPSLLPKYKGLHAHEEALKAKETESGMTIHIINEALDEGQILAQKSCPVLPSDTVSSLQARVQELEKVWYPRVLEMIEKGEMQLPTI